MLSHSAHLGIRRALEAIEAWRSLIRDGAVVLVPVFEVTGRSTPTIARIGEARINAVHGVISSADGALALSSFSTRGVYPTPNWERPKLADRAKGRHASWLYGRELAICDALGALYCPDHVVDLDVAEALAMPHVMPVSGDLNRAVAVIDVPGFSDVPLVEIAKLRNDSNAFHAVREKLRTIIKNSPTEIDELSSGEQAQAYLNEYLISEIAAIHREARELGDGLATRFAKSLLTVGLPTAMTAGAAVGGAGGLVASWLTRRKFSPGERAVLWIERHVNPVNDEAD